MMSADNIQWPIAIARLTGVQSPFYKRAHCFSTDQTYSFEPVLKGLELHMQWDKHGIHRETETEKKNTTHIAQTVETNEHR